MVCAAANSVVYQVALLPSNNGLRYSEQYWCSLPSLVICTVVSQVAVLPSYNSMATVSSQIVRQVALLPSYNSEATVSSLFSLPVPILFQFILIYLNLFWIYLNFVEFLSEKRGCGNA